MNIKNIVRTCASVALASAAALAASASATVVSTTADEVIILNGAPSNTPVGIGYDPTADRYYTGRAGNASFDFVVYDGAGNVVQTGSPIGTDIRGVWYNPNTGQIEANTFNSASNGMVALGRDGAGNLTGSNTALLSSIAGIANSQSVAEYDAGRNVLYSRGTSNIVNVTDYGTGALSSTIALDFTAAGLTNAQQYSIGYDDDEDALIVLDYVAAIAVVFGIDGSFIGTSVLDTLVNPSSQFSMAYENGLMFVFDNAIGGWRGYDIFASMSDPVPLPAAAPLMIGGMILMRKARRKSTNKSA